MSLRQRSNLEESVNERRNYRSGSKNYQSAEQNQPHDNRKEPEFFPLFHKRPQVHQELTHNASSSSLPPGKRKPRLRIFDDGHGSDGRLQNAADHK